MTPEALLTLDPVDAVYAMAQAVLDQQHPGVQARWYRPGAPLPQDDGSVQVLMTLDRAKTPVERWGSLSAFSVRYHRLALNDVIKPTDGVKAVKPSQTTRLVQLLLERYAIPLGDDDVVEAPVLDAGVVTVTSAENSYRWVGNATFTYDASKYTLVELVGRHRVIVNYTPNYNSLDIRSDIVAHLNRINANKLPYPMNAGDIQYGAPQVNGEWGSSTNTRILLTAEEGDYEGQVHVFYKRRTYQESWRKPYRVILPDGLAPGELVTVRSLTEVINAALRVRLLAVDLVDGPITLPNEQQSLEWVVTFNPESLGFLGEVKLLLTWRQDDA